MNHNSFLLIAGIFICTVLLSPDAAALLIEDGDVSALPAISRFNSPFMDKNRERFSSVSRRTFSRFGVHRNTKVKGHLHSGIDLRGETSETVYAMAPGRVVAVYWLFPNRSVAVVHRLPDDSTLYSAYVHIQDITVKPGDSVDENLSLGRLFNQEEMKRSGFGTPHLHLEIRRSMKDRGKRSFTSMTMTDLEEYCLDPFAFLQRRMMHP